MEQQTSSELGKVSDRAIYCHPAYLTYAEDLMWNAGLDEAQVGIKISGRNINNLRYADDTTLVAESKEELKSLLIPWWIYVNVWQNQHSIVKQNKVKIN